MRVTSALCLLFATADTWTFQSRAAALENVEHLTKRWLPTVEKIRGVNLAPNSWKDMGCANYNDEWACVEGIGQAAADKAFKQHWATWTTESDIKQIASLGLNTVRIPVGFWIREDLVYDDEHFPRGGLTYLDRIVGWCKKHGIFVIMDLHAAPGGQSPYEQFTGHSVDPEFYTPENYERAYKFLEWMTKRIHTHENYTTVGVLQVLNEPVHVAAWMDDAADMIENFYPAAYNRIQDMETSLEIADGDRLHIQFMGTSWGSGNPRTYLPSLNNTFFDAHRYLSFDKRITMTKAGYIETACNDDMGRNVVVGEWSLSVNSTLKNTDEFKIDGQKTWYTSYWAAQAQSFERSNGWIFWSWKCDGTDDWRWCYKSAVAAGVIPENAGTADSLSPC
ncbi:glycoside hydrolase superfamily [Dactylonectria estremocensis]|uniref:glucan 1,3-beta-glucosidase n=1 Tax=Dactylonectria estremocensis TaxID=1079267 RepID=A0A9P9JEG7_9HYPO|nr:glycoside hydrolase superfamily [Dactylonectria estremocensis]